MLRVDGAGVALSLPACWVVYGAALRAGRKAGRPSVDQLAQFVIGWPARSARKRSNLRPQPTEESANSPGFRPLPGLIRDGRRTRSGCLPSGEKPPREARGPAQLRGPGRQLIKENGAVYPRFLPSTFWDQSVGGGDLGFPSCQGLAELTS